jgi:cobalt-precorrin 5A hydrolase
VIALAGVPSVAEAAALAAAGPAARLIVARIAVGPATCALADAGAAS